MSFVFGSANLQRAVAGALILGVACLFLEGLIGFVEQRHSDGFAVSAILAIWFSLPQFACATGVVHSKDREVLVVASIGAILTFLGSVFTLRDVARVGPTAASVESVVWPIFSTVLVGLFLAGGVLFGWLFRPIRRKL